MEIKQLRYFMRVADAGSVSRAAAALSVAQPAVSRQIANLEDGLGTPLFFRNGRGVKLTDAGQELYAHTRAILEAVRQAEENVRDTVGIARGRILIGSTPTVVRHLAPPLMRRIAQSHPELDLEFTEGYSGYVNEWLSNGLLDVAILHDATRTQHFLTESLLAEELVLLVPANSPEPEDAIAFNEVCERRLVLPRRHHGVRIMVERAAATMRLSLAVVAELDSPAAMMTMVREDDVATILPRGAVGTVEGLRARPITPALHRSLILATSSQRPVSQTTRAVIDELKGVVRELLSSGAWPGAARPGEVPPSALVPAAHGVPQDDAAAA